MKRLIYQYLHEWARQADRQVLLLRGARQVGKTHSIRHLARSFVSYVEVNFEESHEVREFFKQGLDVGKIVQKLAAFYGQTIQQGQTLLFFDEIQACPEAIQCLRFFREKMPGLHVVAAGSLLELVLGELSSFGVGRISSLFMYPMSFKEFFLATQNQGMIDEWEKAGLSSPTDPVFHQKFLEIYRSYQITGGLPAVVDVFRQSGDYLKCQERLDSLITSFEDDFVKYRKRAPVLRLQEVFRSIVSQTGHKFKYNHIAEGASSHGYSEALQLIVKAGLAYPVYHTDAQGLPLGAQIDHRKFKMILFDAGIYQRLLGLNIGQHLALPQHDFIHKGNLSEMFVGLEMIANSSPRLRPALYYWHREAKSSNAEIDYVIQIDDRIVPVEVKAGTKGQMQSFHLFLAHCRLKYGVRVSSENFSQYGQVQVFPVYAMDRLIRGN